MFLDALPAVLRRIPDAEILVINKNAHNGIRAKASRYGDRVRFLDYVPDISGVMATAAAMVAPISFGTGVKMKVLDALAHGLPLVSTEPGSRRAPRRWSPTISATTRTCSRRC